MHGLLLRTIINENHTCLMQRDSVSKRSAKRVKWHSYPPLLWGLALALLASSANSETAEIAKQNFSQVHESVVALEILNAKGKRVAEASGVAIGEGQVVTSCSAIQGGTSIQARGRGKSFKAVVHHKRQDLDLCQLSVADMGIPAVALGTANNLRVGVLVHAIAASSGQNAQPTVSTAEISGLLPYEGSWYMRVSAVPSTGFQGAGLFNDAGKLVGIISRRGAEGQKLAFALPADWIKDMGLRDMEKQSSPASAHKKEGGLDWLNRSFALEKKGDWRGLLKLSQQQVSRDPHSAAGWFEVASACAHLKQYKQAVHAYREAIRNQASYGDAWHGLGTAYMHLKEYDHAARALRDAVRLQPDNAEAWYALGNAYYKSEQYPHAIHAYDQSLRFDPGNATAWYSLGKAYDELDLYGDAIDAYRETVRIEPKNVDALYSLGVDYAIAGERAEMRRIYSTLLPLDQTKAEQYFNTYILP